MIVSGGKILAIGKVNVGTGLSGDGVALPIGLTSEYPIVSSYDISAGQNIFVDRVEDSPNNNITFFISANGGTSTSDLQAGTYIDITNDFINVDLDLINSASSGYRALETIQNNSAVWEKDWSTEIESAVTGKLDKTVFADYSDDIYSWQNTTDGNIDDIDQSVSDISAYIEEHEDDWEKDWSTEIETAVTGKLDKTVFVDYSGDIYSWQNTTDGNIDAINQSAINISAYIEEHEDDWEKDWSTEIETAVTGKLDKTVFADYSAGITTWQNTTEDNIDAINQSAINISAYIEEHEDEWILNDIDVEMETPTPDYLKIESTDIGTNGVKFSISAKDWSTEIESAVTGKLDKTVFADYSADIYSWQNTTEDNIDDINQSAINISAYIEEHEAEWLLSGIDVEMETLTPDYLSIESANIGTNGVKFSVSAIEPTKYNAGDWIDSENLETGTISVSGHRGIFLNDPLYWTSADIDGSIRYYVNVSDLNSSEIETAVTGKLDKTVFADYSADIYSWQNTTEDNIDDINQSAINISAYIEEHEAEWLLSGIDVEMETLTPDYLSIESANIGTNGVKFSISAKDRSSEIETVVTEITENTTVTLVAGQNRYLTCTNDPTILVEITDNNIYHLQINGSCTINLTGVSWGGDEITAITTKAEISILNGIAVGVLYE